MIFRHGDMTNRDFPCEIVRRLPGGVMAELYLARLQNTQHYMAVKGVSRNAPVSHKRALKKEAEVLSMVRFESIPEIYGCFEDAEKEYFIMSYHEGENLEKVLLKRNISEQSIKQIGLSLCSVLAYIHKKGIVYGDLKPSNIIWSKNHLMLLDFGAAMFLDKEEQDIYFSGTAGYAAPEWFCRSNRKITCSADVFSLGATLYRLLEGKEPRQNYGKFILTDKQKKNSWQTVLDECCAPMPENRYRSMAHIYEAISSIEI